MNQVNNYSQYPVVCFGEILWDVLPNCAVPGGAPMNVAYHLKKLGVNPALITRVGTDDWGKNLIHLMEKNQIDTNFFQVDFELPTGKVNATICENNEMSYEILMPVAWDNIQWDKDFEALLADSGFLVFGSLATRLETTRNTLYQLLEIANYKVVDINLRPPHYNKEVIKDLLSNANLLKLNLAELELITGWISDYKSEEERVKMLQDVFHIENIVVTKGGDGALLNVGGVFYGHPGFPIEVKDTVGSGDAFLAALLSKLLAKSSPEEALAFASGLGALIATYTGACPDYKTEEISAIMQRKKLHNSFQ
jgi:fructokinase